MPVGAGAGESPWPGRVPGAGPGSCERRAPAVPGVGGAGHVCAPAGQSGAGAPICGWAPSPSPTPASPVPGATPGRYLFKSARGRASVAPCDFLKGRAGRAAAGAGGR